MRQAYTKTTSPNRVEGIVMNYYVEIVKYDTNEVVERMGPMSERQADKVDSGANINLNHEEYFTRVVSDSSIHNAH
jgi:hypothetical protein